MSTPRSTERARSGHYGLVRSRGSRLFAVCAFAVLLTAFAATTTSCSRECNKRVYQDLVRIVVPATIPTSGATICVNDDCQPASATDPDGSSSVIVNGVTVQNPHAVQLYRQRLRSGSVKIRFVMAGTAPIDAVITTRPTTDTHGGCATQRLVSLQYDPTTRSLALGPDIPSYAR